MVISHSQIKSHRSISREIWHENKVGEGSWDLYSCWKDLLSGLDQDDSNLLMAWKDGKTILIIAPDCNRFYTKRELNLDHQPE